MYRKANALGVAFLQGKRNVTDLLTRCAEVDVLTTGESKVTHIIMQLSKATAIEVPTKITKGIDGKQQ